MNPLRDENDVWKGARVGKDFESVKPLTMTLPAPSTTMLSPMSTDSPPSSVAASNDRLASHLITKASTPPPATGTPGRLGVAGCGPVWNAPAVAGNVPPPPEPVA